MNTLPMFTRGSTPLERETWFPKHPFLRIQAGMAQLRPEINSTSITLHVISIANAQKRAGSTPLRGYLNGATRRSRRCIDSIQGGGGTPLDLSSSITDS